jgi:hypothetical protein
MRIENRVYFLSDINNLKKMINFYACVFEDSQFLSWLSLKKLSSGPLVMPAVKSNKVSTPSPELELLANFLIFKHYSHQQNITVVQSLIENLKKSQVENKCVWSSTQDYQQDTQVLMEMAKLEVFFSARFGDESIVVSESELQQAKQTDNKKSPQELRQTVMVAKRREAIKLLSQTIVRQMGHEYF